MPGKRQQPRSTTENQNRSRRRPLPKDTADVVGQRTLKECRNLGLILDKFQPWDQVTGIEKKKGTWYNDLCNYNHPIIDSVLLAAYRQRWLNLTKQYGATEAAELRFKMTTESRLVVGLGSASTFETGILLHRVYGFPFIPGSAIKGVTRTYALIALAKQLGIPLNIISEESHQQKQSEDGNKPKQTPFQQLVQLLDTSLTPENEHAHQRLEKAFQELKKEATVIATNGLLCTMSSYKELAKIKDVRFFQRIFGYPGASGSILFFDALPCAVPKLDVDVMNVHYPEYYGNTEPPADNQQPRPISFLTVKQGTDFCFAVARRRYIYGTGTDTDNDKEDMEVALTARIWLQHALCDIGIGAKTVAGYGYFTQRR